MFLIKSRNSHKFRRNLTSQAAMEFMMTYGWAILVVLVAIGALAYFGVLSPDKFLQNRCQLAPGVTCLDFNVQSSKIELSLQNNIGEDIIISEVSVIDQEGDPCVSTGSISLRNSEKAVITITDCNVGFSGEKFSGDLTVTYTKVAALTHVIKGTIITRIETGDGGDGDGDGGNGGDGGDGDGEDIVYPECKIDGDCNVGEGCLLPDNLCGVPNLVGTCTTPPGGCGFTINEECGCNGITYTNKCFRLLDLEQLDHVGACVPPPLVYPDCWVDSDCNTGEGCLLPDGECISPSIGTCFDPSDIVCPGFNDPVCGCNAVEYWNDCFRLLDVEQLDHVGACAGGGGGK